MIAVEHANKVLAWMENLLEEELPPEWMWPLDHELEGWFEEVKRKRKERYGRPDDEDTEAPMMQNELARKKRGR